MPKPELLKRKTTEQKSTKTEQISKWILALPQVFACDISRNPLRVMVLEKDEKALEEITNKLKKMGLSDEEYFVQIVKVEPLSDKPSTSGAHLYAHGSNKSGTLGGFAKFKYNKTDTTYDVAITARHVVYPSQICVDGQVIGSIMEEKSAYDITMAEVHAKSKYDTRFRKENGEFCFADVYDSNNDGLKSKAVHFWGATTGLAKANISEIPIGRSFASVYIMIKIRNQEKTAFASPGDSGAMILMELYPRSSESMFALGILVGEILPWKEENAGKSTDACKGKLPFTKGTQTAVQLTAKPIDQRDQMLSDDQMHEKDTMPSKKTNIAEKPTHQEDPLHQDRTQLSYVTCAKSFMPSENPHSTEDTEMSDPVPVESPISSEDNTHSEDPKTNDCTKPVEVSIPINDDSIPLNPSSSSDTNKTYLIVCLKNGFEYLSKTHDGTLSLYKV
ncbi:uncharacterized protein LOC128223648 [Mya arenaria]|uniref:uncharacterized protein LOC128223648 n=1 Tax=Mya arenaria TaxID=6604 RepID=UPI0022E0CA01|nr:uncharacterized protein LOC128223648 [Mya arenaria]